MSVLTKNETMTSLEIAEVTGKAHKELLRSIRNMESAWEKICGRKFALTSQLIDMPNGGAREEPCYSLNKTECLYIATKFNDEARAKLVLRWQELEENAHKSELTMPNFSNPAEAARAWADLYEKRLALEADKERLLVDNTKKDAEIVSLSNTVAEMKPKATYVDAILSSKETVTTTQIAQDYGKSAKAFNVLLRNFGIQHKVSGQWILYAKHLPYGYIQSDTIQIQHKDGTFGTVMHSKWTQKGRLFLYEELKKHDVLPMIEQK